jgi:hypothetical protein
MERHGAGEAGGLLMGALLLLWGIAGWRDRNYAIGAGIGVAFVSIQQIARAGVGDWWRRGTLAVVEGALGADHPRVATRLINRALLLQSRGELAAARSLLGRGLAIRERALGPDHEWTTATCQALADLVGQQDRAPAPRFRGVL